MKRFPDAWHKAEIACLASWQGPGCVLVKYTYSVQTLEVSTNEFTMYFVILKTRIPSHYAEGGVEQDRAAGFLSISRPKNNFEYDCLRSFILHTLFGFNNL